MALVTVNNLTKTYDEKYAVDNVSFKFHSGKCIALIGPNGAGKTTILRILAGLIEQTSGKIHFSEANVNNDIRSLIGYLPQYPVFYSWMTGKEFLIYCGELALLSKAEATERAEQLLDRVGISDAKNKRIGKYSGGMKQRLGIAQAIIHRPKLLMMDEPVSSLDPIGRREVLTLMKELQADMTILFSTHILTDADEISDELLLLHEGKIVESGSLDELRQKYQTTIIELEFEKDLEYYQTKIDALSSTITSSLKQNVVHVTVKNIEQARQEIVSTIAEANWPLVNFTVNRASLEDMFMKAVNN